MEITISYVPNRFLDSPHIEVENHQTSEVAIILNYQIPDFLSASGIDGIFPQSLENAEIIWAIAQDFEGQSNAYTP